VLSRNHLARRELDCLRSFHPFPQSCVVERLSERQIYRLVSGWTIESWAGSSKALQRLRRFANQSVNVVERLDHNQDVKEQNPREGRALGRQARGFQIIMFCTVVSIEPQEIVARDGATY